MPIAIQCPTCHRKYNAPEKAAGRKVPCPACKTAISVPNQQVEDEYQLWDEDGIAASESPATTDLGLPTQTPLQHQSEVAPQTTWQKIRQQAFSSTLATIGTINLVSILLIVFLSGISQTIDTYVMGIAILIAAINFLLCIWYFISALYISLRDSPGSNLFGVVSMILIGQGFIRVGTDAKPFFRYMGLSLTCFAFTFGPLLTAQLMLGEEIKQRKSNRRPPATSDELGQTR